jgi:dATP pyrophosphohydrolase
MNAFMRLPCYKRPVSVLVVIHTPALDVLLLERASHAGFWQSVTGSQEESETLIETARREVAEETGIAALLKALVDWRVTHTFSLRARRHARHRARFLARTAAAAAVRLAPDEHLAYVWLPWYDAAAKCFSWTNRDAILMLPEKRAR